MNFLEKLDYLMLRNKINKNTLSKLSNVPYTTIDAFYKKGYQNAKLTTLKKIASYFDTTLDYLICDEITDPNYGKSNGFKVSYDEMLHIKKYRALDEYGRKAIDTLLDIETARIEKANLSTSETIQLFPMVEYLQPASAGTGQYLDDSSFTNLTLVKEPPRGASYIVRVKGDSMEPTYSDGDRVFVGTTYEIRIGDVGLFWADGDVYIKERGEDGLISHNCKYPLIRCNGYRDIRPLGKILGKCTEEYLTKK